MSKIIFKKNAKIQLIKDKLSSHFGTWFNYNEKSFC